MANPNGDAPIIQAHNSMNLLVLLLFVLIRVIRGPLFSSSYVGSIPKSLTVNNDFNS